MIEYFRTACSECLSTWQFSVILLGWWLALKGLLQLRLKIMYLAFICRDIFSLYRQNLRASNEHRIWGMVCQCLHLHFVFSWCPRRAALGSFYPGVLPLTLTGIILWEGAEVAIPERCFPRLKRWLTKAGLQRGHLLQRSHTGSGYQQLQCAQT